MTSQEAYVTFLLLANKLTSNDNINIDIGRFVLLYNKAARVWLEQRVRKTKSNQKIDEIQQLVVKDVALTIINSTQNYINFELPEDWFDHIGGYAVCTRGTCTGNIVNADQVKNDEKRLILFDDNWRPNFDFEWLPIAIGEGSIQVYFKDFIVDGFYIDYFKYPKNIDIEGYIKADNTTQSTNIDPELDDIYVNEIIDLVVADVSRIYQNNEKMQLDLNRIQQDT